MAAIFARLVPGLLAVALPLAAGEASSVGNDPSQDYKDKKAELEAMLEKAGTKGDQRRDLEVYELTFEPIELGRVLLTDRMGGAHVYNFLAFRLRNQMSLGGLQPSSQAKGFNEVLAATAQQYEASQVVKEDNGTALRIGSVEGKDGEIVARQDARVRTRAVDLSVLAYDEHGNRLKTLAELNGSKPPEAFDQPDVGFPSQSTLSGLVREKVEELLDRRLLTTDEIRSRQLPPFDPTKRSEEGWGEGEVCGVMLFDRLSDHGRAITLQVHGLSNKFRIHWVPGADPAKPENYLETRFLRRTYVLHYERPGDEYYRDRDRFELVSSGWEWVPSFQRNASRRTQAYTRYFLNNIVANQADALNAPVEAEAWAWYQEQRALPGGERLPDLQTEMKPADR